MHPPNDLLDFLQICGVRSGLCERLPELQQLLDYLRDANTRHNLTRLTSDDDFWIKHIADCLAVGGAWPELLTAPLRIADVGCGAGFPTLPLAWANPELRITAIESIGKKAGFVQEAAAHLGLKNVTVVPLQCREAARNPDHAGAYDGVLLRAVGTPGKFLRETRGLVRNGQGGRIVFYTTPEAIAKESAVTQREAAKFGFRVAESVPLQLPRAMGERSFLTLERNPIDS